MALVVGTSATPATDTTGVSASQTFSCTTAGADRLIYVYAGIGTADNASRTVSTCTYNGVSLGRIWQANEGVWPASEGWFLPTNAINTEPASGANNVVVTWAGTSWSQRCCCATPFEGAHQTTPLGTSVTSTGTGTGPTIDVSSASGEIVVNGIASDDQTNLNASTGTQLWAETILGSDTAFWARYYTGATTVTTAYTQDSERYALGGVSVKPSGAAAAAAGSGPLLAGMRNRRVLS